VIAARRRVALWPRVDSAVVAAVVRAGGEVVPPEDASAVLWMQSKTAGIREVLLPQHEWVFLPAAGVDRWFASGIIDEKRIWTDARGVYARGVAEHTVALILAALRRLPECLRATSWERRPGRLLAGLTVVIVGAGGIGQATARLLAPFSTRLVAVTRSGLPVEHFSQVIPATGLLPALASADIVVLAVPLTSSTRELIAADELRAIGPGGCLVNVARGALVDTAALVRSLQAGELGSAALDVTEPEPLPVGHPLWTMPNVVITPHVANPALAVPWDAHEPEMLERIERDVRAWINGAPFENVIDPARGY